MKEYPKIIKDVERWPIRMFYRDRQRIVQKLATESIDALIEENDLVEILNQTVYAEKLRTKSEPLKVDPPKEAAFWKKIESELSNSMTREDDGANIQRDLVQRIVNRYSEEIVGDFNPKTFGFARNVLSRVFKMLYNPFLVKGAGLFWGNRDTLLDKFRIHGPLDHIRTLFDKGTVIMMPTHFSNLDSILIGYAIEMLTGLPPFSYGAGLNLYDYELMAYYMSRLGAYKIDRRKKNPIYRKTLDQFSTVSIQEGLNSLFFPGGTRSRSGALEDKLKWGLMNTIIEAQNEFFLRNFDKKIIIVPLVVSYHFVLESQGLIDQHLRRTGKEKYIGRSKRKNASMKRIRFIRRLFSRGSNVTLSFGHPIDIFGNKLDEQGRSIKNDRVIDIREYFLSQGTLSHDKQRNRVYSRYLAERIVESYRRENVVLTSHLVSFTAFQMFFKQYPNLDLYALLTLPEDYLILEPNELYEQVSMVQKRLIELEKQGSVRLSQEVRSHEPQDLVTDALKNINAYHFHAPLLIKKGQVICEDLKLLYYYHNRLFGYKLDRIVSTNRKQSLILKASLYG